MPHQVLECLEVHARLRHIAAVGMAADVGSDIRHLHLADIVVPLNHVVESLSPMHTSFYNRYIHSDIQKRNKGETHQPLQ